MAFLMRLILFLLPVGTHCVGFGQSASSQHPLTSPATRDERPNIVLILTDDQDLHMNSLDYVPLIKEHLLDRGTLFRRHFCTTAICCPARVTLLTGKAAHNTNVTDVFPPHGGYPKFVREGHNENYLPVFLQDLGYNTYYTGKLFNAHTIYNYNNPYPAGWNGSDFLLDPNTYVYLNATYQRNQDPPVSYEGQYTTDVLAQKALGFLDDAIDADGPFFLGIAPIAPHSNVDAMTLPDDYANNVTFPDPDFTPGITPPVPAERHAHLFPDAVVPRTSNFNPDAESGASWIRQQPKQSAANVAANDHFYRNRLRALQAVDELVAEVVSQLESAGVLDNTYIFYTTDNGYHIGHHRLQPGKECGYEEDVNIPLIVRGPGVPAGEESEVVTTHADLVPTILGLAGAGGLRSDMDGVAIPLSSKGLAEAVDTRHEHVTVEYWGYAMAEGPWGFFGTNTSMAINNTYKALRIISKEYNLYYSVWCSGEHELYDLNTDPGQMKNILRPDSGVATLLGLSIDKIVPRLDSLLLVTKSCKGWVCAQPWRALHPQGNVDNLRDALSPRFDRFYEQEQVKVEYSRCELGYLIDAEGPQFERDGLAYLRGSRWSDWV